MQRAEAQAKSSAWIIKMSRRAATIYYSDRAKGSIREFRMNSAALAKSLGESNGSTAIGGA
jgi:hypothetical protein